MLLGIFYLFGWFLLRKKEVIIEIFQKGVLFLFTIFFLLKFKQVKFLSFVAHFMNNLDQIQSKFSSPHIL